MAEIELFENLKSIVERDPSNFQAKRELAILCLDMGFEKTALNHLNSLSQIFPEDSNLFFNIGICWEKLGNLKFAFLLKICYNICVKISRRLLIKRLK